MRVYNSNLSILMFLAGKAGLHGTFQASTSELAEQMATSQQTVSRKLRELERLGMITRTVNNEGVIFSLKDQARELLKINFVNLKNLFEFQKLISGNVFSGLGEGRYYVGLDGYKKQFMDKLGFVPYPGTLNLNVDGIKLKGFLQNLDKIDINGFETPERTFGGIDCYKIKLNDIVAGLIIPHRTLHNDGTVEIIAADYLRDKLNLEDGNIVKITVES